MSLTIRRTQPGDETLILAFIAALAEYEQLADKVVATPADLTRDLFGPTPQVFCEIAEWNGEPVGFALWFYTYSTFRGRHGLWLEDLFVAPDMRGKGIGKRLLVHLAQRCVAEGLPRFEWGVLDWNQPSIDFYKSQGAVIMDAWEHCRVDGEALLRLAQA